MSASTACGRCAIRATKSALRRVPAPSRACSARNGSGRNCTTRSIRGHYIRRPCAKRPNDPAQFRPRLKVVANPPELGAKPRLGYTASLLDRMAQRRDDELAIKKLCEHARAGVYVIGGEFIMLKGTGAQAGDQTSEICDPLFSPAEANALG